MSEAFRRSERNLPPELRKSCVLFIALILLIAPCACPLDLLRECVSAVAMPPRFELPLLLLVTLLLFANMSAIFRFYLIIIKILTFQKYVKMLTKIVRIEFSKFI